MNSRLYLRHLQNRTPSCDFAFSSNHSLHAFFTKPSFSHVSTRRPVTASNTSVSWAAANSRQAHLRACDTTDVDSADGVPGSAEPVTADGIDIARSNVSSLGREAVDSSVVSNEGDEGRTEIGAESPSPPQPPRRPSSSFRANRTAEMIEASQPPARPQAQPSIPERTFGAPTTSAAFGSGKWDNPQPIPEQDDSQKLNNDNQMRKKPRTVPFKKTVASVEAGLRAQRAAELQELQEQMQSNTMSEESSTMAAFSLSERMRQEGHLAESNGEHVLAAQLYWRSVQLDAQNGKAWQNLAKSEGRRKRSMRASAAVLRRALGQNPRNAYLWQSLGFLLFRMRQYDDARTHFQTGITRDPNHAPLYSTWAHLEFALKNYSRARELYDTGSAITDGGARVYHNWGQMELKLGNEMRARELFDKGLELEPFNAYIWETLGSLAKKENNFEVAKQCYLNALESEENNVVVLEAWAKLEVLIGDHAKAREIFERGVNADIRDSRILHSWSTFEYQVRSFFPRTCHMPLMFS